MFNGKKHRIQLNDEDGVKGNDSYDHGFGWTGPTCHRLILTDSRMTGNIQDVKGSSEYLNPGRQETVYEIRGESSLVILATSSSKYTINTSTGIQIYGGSWDREFCEEKVQSFWTPYT